MKILMVLALFVAGILSGPMLIRATGQDNPSGTVESSPSPAQGTRVTGQLTHIEGWHYTIKDSTGQEVSFGVTSDTKDPDKVKEGDHIVVTIGEDRIARTVRNIKKKG